MCRVVVGCALGCGRPHRAFRESNQLTALPESFGQLTALKELELSRARPFGSSNQLTALPESFGQLTALKELKLSRASACAEWRCCCGPWTVELGER